MQVARHLRDRTLERALMQVFEPENWFEVREALVEAGRCDLIGTGCDALTSPNLPKEAIDAWRMRANAGLRNDRYHSVANPVAGAEASERPTPPRIGNRGYRPGRKTQARRSRGK